MSPRLAHQLHSLGAGAVLVHGGVRHVRVLRGGVVAPDGHLAHRGGQNAKLRGHLADGAVVVQARKRADVLGRYPRRKVAQDECVGVGRVAHDQDLDVRAGVLIDDAALLLEDVGVLLQQVVALHASLAREGTHQDGVVCVLERLHGVGSRDHVCVARAASETRPEPGPRARAQPQSAHQHPGCPETHSGPAGTRRPGAP